MDATTDVNAQPPTPAEQVQEVVAATDLFSPRNILPVNIDFVTDCSNPYELSQDVTYSNGIVNVLMEKGFKWDGASIPPWLPILPWVLTMVAMQFVESAWLWAVTAILVAYTIRLLPYMQKMGLHARGCGVHDKLYKAQTVARVVADAIMLSILESDGVPWDVRTLIYRRVRQFGWYAWRRNKRNIPARKAAAKDVEVTR